VLVARGEFGFGGGEGAEGYEADEAFLVSLLFFVLIVGQFMYSIRKAMDLFFALDVWHRQDVLQGFFSIFGCFGGTVETRGC
jgi:hypothetical protein